MKSLADAEIEDQMEATKKEYQDTVNAARGPEPALPPGVSRHDFTKWKEQQAVAARRRLAELEDRLQRLQLLRTKLAKMKANADDTLLQTDTTLGQSFAKASDHHAGSWTLPGQAQTTQQHRQQQQQQQQPGPPAKLGALNASGDAQWTTLEDVEGDLDSPARNAEPADDEVPAGEHTRMPAYLPPPHQPGMAPPFTPGMSGLRRIIRDEMNAVVSEVVTHQLHNSKTSDQHSPGADTKAGSPDAQDAGRPRTTRQAWTARTTGTVDTDLPPDDDSDETSLPKREAIVIPRTLDAAEPKSCPLIFGGLSRQSPLRMKCLAMVHSKFWGSIFYTNTILSCIYSGMIVETGLNLDSNRSPAFDVVEYVLTGVFAFEILIGVMALGFINGRTTWLRISGMNMLDFVIMLAIISEYILNALGYAGVTVVPFRMLRTLKLLSYFKYFSGIRVIVTTLMVGGVQLQTVFFVLLFFLMAMSTLLLTFLRDSFSRRCVVLDQFNGPCVADFSTGWASSSACDFNNWESTKQTYSFDTPDSNFPIMIEDFYPFERFCKIMNNVTAGEYNGNPNYELDFKGRYHTCGAGRPNYQPGTEMCVEVGNPSYGFSHFDDIGGSMINLAQGAAPDSYYDIIWRSSYSEPQAFMFYPFAYLIVTLMTTWLLLGIFVAVVTGTYQTVRIDVKERENAELAIKEAMELEVFEKHGHVVRHVWDTEKTYEERRQRMLELQKKNNIRQDRRAKSVTIEDDVSHVHEFDADTVEIKQDGTTAMYVDELMVVQARKVLKHRRYPDAVSCLIVAHCLAMACDQHDAPKSWRDYAQYAYLICNIGFGGEVIVRLLAFSGQPGFLSSRLNVFELVMLFMGVVGIVFQIPLLKLVPALRLYRLMQYLPTLEHLLILAIGSLAAMGNLFVFVVIVMMAVTITGRYVFGQSMSFTRSNFDSFSEALITVFQLFTGDSWSGVVYAAMHSMQGRFEQIYAGLFVLAWFTFSSFIINNLFVAVIIENFEVAETITNISKPGYLASLRKSFSDGWQTLSVKSQAVIRGDVKLDVHGGGNAHDPLDESFVFRKGLSAQGGQNPAAHHGSMQLKSAMAGKGNSKRSWLMKVVSYSTVRYVEETEPDDFDESVLYCIHPGSRVRRFFIWLGEQKMFDAAVYGAIIVSCVFLILSPPGGLSSEDIARIDPSFVSPLSDQTLRWCGYLFTFIFTAEFFVRVLDYGLLFTKRAYLKDGWNVLDSIILLISWLDFLTEFLNMEDFQGGRLGKVLRLGRALRPLRLMKRNESMRAVIDALIGTLRPVAYVILFLLLTMVVFGLVGMGLFGSKYQHCSTQDLLYYTADPAVSFPFGMTECVGAFIRDDGVMIQRAWVNPSFHFDSFSESFMTLFVVQTKKFVFIMQMSMDLTDAGTSPKRNVAIYNALFFVCYVMVGGVFVMNLFVGFIVDGFNCNKGSSTSEIYYNRFMGQLKRYRPTYKRFSLPANGFSVLCRKLIDSSYWQSFSSACVAVNVGVNLTDHKGASLAYDDFIETQNTIFNFVLFFEVFITLLGFGPGGFIDDKWKGFDAFVAFGSLAGMVAQSPSISKFSKAFRLVRILRLMIMIRAIRVILETLISALPQLVNIMVLLFLVYSIAAVMLVQIYGMTKYGYRVGDTAGFYNYPRALYTIYQIVVGDEWHVMMSDCSVQWPECTPSFDENFIPGWNAWKGGPFMSTVTDCGLSKGITFTAWMLIKVVCENIMLNLFIGMILDNFSFITDEVSHVEDSKWTAGPSANQVHQISQCFTMFDNRSGLMPISSLHGFLLALPQPLGFRKPNGAVQFGLWERACERLIRAELNVLVRYQRGKLLERQMHSWNPFQSISNKHQDHVHKVDFIHFIQTCLFWRKPDMVPVFIKASRWKRVDETILTAYALVMVDCMGRAVSFKRAKKTRVHLKGMIEFQQWEGKDDHRQHRRRMYLEEVAAEKKLSALEKKKPLALYWNCTDKVRMVLEQVSYLPEDMISHHMAVRSNKLKVPKPINGLEVFRNFSETHLVVMKFLDPRHKKSGYVIVDFRSINFNGWYVKNDALYSFLLPSTRRTKLAQVPEPWTKIEVVMFKGKSLLARSREKNLGSLLDIQSFVHSEGHTREEMLASATSHVRFNLGALRMESLVNEVTGHNQYEKGPNEMFVVADSILQVVGYTPLALAAGGAGDMATALNSSRQTENAKASQVPTSPGNYKMLQDVDTVEEQLGEHQETESEIEAREAEELRLAEEEYAAQQAVEQELKDRVANTGQQAQQGAGQDGNRAEDGKPAEQ